MRTKRRLKKKVKIAIIIFILLVIIVESIFLFIPNKKEKNEKKTNDEVDIEQPIKKKTNYSIKLLMVGDALIHNGIYEDALKSNGTYDFKPMLEYIKPISSKYDLAYYNQETILGGAEIGYSSYPRFNSPQEVGDAFLDAGFNLVSLANNHTMDKGEAGVINSVNYWKTKKDVVYTGQWLSNEQRNKPMIYEKNGIKYAFLAYTTWTNGLETPKGKEYLNNVYSNAKAKNDIAKVRDKVDFVIVAMHWGVEYSLNVSQSQDTIAKYLSNLGVDLIIGCHPHVVEPAEYINNGKTFVIYSLGNFISDHQQKTTDRLTGLMLEVTLEKKVNESNEATTSITNPKGELIYTYSNKTGKRNFKVYPYSKLNNQLLPNYQNLEKKYQKIINSKGANISWELLE